MTKLDTTIWLFATQDLSSLLKVLHSYNNQNYRLFEVLVIADYNFDAVNEFLKALEDDFFFSINVTTSGKAIENTKTDSVVLSNTEIIVEKRFIEEHVKLREEGFYVWGEHIIFKNTESINIEDIYKDNCFEVKWLRENGLNLRLNESENVGNISVWKTDLKTLEIRNYFESKQVLLSKLNNLPLKAKKQRIQLICLHLQGK